ncbi:hypothetical protein [Granulicella sibirica]|uniref:DUF5872 domain-containing protein n=1 Tax=Granulicella sibirica TaxID=2479048 RepID=A0A4Q0T0X2_9BACT|nr:hypothetical protein [Granulicella sibirica]RXH55499.1 hypothetical protein GRAN_2356 [Granulicella sibirica]
MTAKKAAAKKTAAKKPPAKKTAANYTDPALREKIKQKLMKGDKGGKPNQWSARKAQLVASEYKAEGGEYKHERSESQQHLKDWGDEKWHTTDGKPAIQEKSTSRYLPDKAWDKLTPAEQKATDAKKKRASKTGKQFVPNTEKAKKARKSATKK